MIGMGEEAIGRGDDSDLTTLVEGKERVGLGWIGEMGLGWVKEEGQVHSVRRVDEYRYDVTTSLRIVFQRQRRRERDQGVNEHFGGGVGLGFRWVYPTFGLGVSWVYPSFGFGFRWVNPTKTQWWYTGREATSSFQSSNTSINGLSLSAISLLDLMTMLHCHGSYHTPPKEEGI